MTWQKEKILYLNIEESKRKHAKGAGHTVRA